MHPSFLLNLKRSWHALLNLGFGLICIRFLVEAGRVSDWTFILISTTSFVLAWWRPSACLVVLILGSSLISGIEKTVLSFPRSTLLTIASALWLGLAAHRLTSISSAKNASRTPTTYPSYAASPIDLVVDVMVTIALLSLFIQIWRHDAAPNLWSFLSPEASGDVSYFLPGFLWLHGLFYFRAMRVDPSFDLTTPDGIRLAFLVNSLVLFFFFGVQWLFAYPYRPTPGFQSPFEDIATFGIMAAVSLILYLALLRPGRNLRLLLHGLGSLLLAAAVWASWSRGAWLATATFLMVLLWLRLPRPLMLTIIAALIGAIAFINLSTRQITYEKEPYLYRLSSLVRIENPLAKSVERIELYQKAWAMIRARPLTGHGIGAFFAEAPRYARPGDPNAGLPQYAHNILLQLAAEQGVPAALLFVCLTGWALWRGIHCWNSFRRSKPTAGGVTEEVHSVALLTLALTLAFGAYLQANMTWEILLVHPTQPYFFWFLLAALWATIERTGALLNVTASQS